MTKLNADGSALIGGVGGVLFDRTHEAVVNGPWMGTFGRQGLEVGLELWNLAYGNWFYNVYDSGGGYWIVNNLE